jgi:hypothetical protein
VRVEPTKAKARIATAAEIVVRRGDERERSHVGVLSLAIHGQLAQALERALAHADIWPRDVLILSLPLGAFGLLAFSGMADHDQARVDLCERHARHFEADDWWFLTYRGWAHAENGAVAQGRELTQRGCDLRRNNANGVHALSHAIYEGGAGEEADKLIAGWLPGYDRSGILHGHIAWHAALAALEGGDAERALAIYGEHVQPSVSAGLPVNVISDTASFLWRLQAYGHQVPQGLWQAAAAYAAPSLPEGRLRLCQRPYGPARGRQRRQGRSGATDLRPGRTDRGRNPGRWPGGPAVCRAALAFAEEDYANCARIWSRSRPRLCASAAAAPSARSSRTCSSSS